MNLHTELQLIIEYSICEENAFPEEREGAVDVIRHRLLLLVRKSHLW